jgi:hypothetical protein
MPEVRNEPVEEALATATTFPLASRNRTWTPGIGAPVASGINFALTAGGHLEGTVTDGGGMPVKNALGEIFAAPWLLPAATGVTNQVGHFITGSGLPDGTDYHARTANSRGFINEVFDNQPCTASCLPQNGQAISITAPLVTTGVDFAVDLDSDGDGDGIAGSIDRNRVTLVDESTASSNDFTDVAIAGTTSGTVAARAGWDVTVVDVSPLGIQVGLSGNGAGPAVLDTCHEGDAENVHLDAAGGPDGRRAGWNDRRDRGAGQGVAPSRRIADVRPVHAACL